ncbi:MAG: hypothetical protein AABY22_16140 [Nanoarchaeota archaeon]
MKRKFITIKGLFHVKGMGGLKARDKLNYLKFDMNGIEEFEIVKKKRK